MNHHGDLFVDIKVRISASCSQAKEGAFGVFVAAMSYQPPWRLGAEDTSNEDRDRPNPLNREWNSPAPLRVSKVVDSSKNSTADQLTKDPAEVDVGCLERYSVV